MFNVLKERNENSLIRIKITDGPMENITFEILNITEEDGEYSADIDYIENEPSELSDDIISEEISKVLTSVLQSAIDFMSKNEKL